LSFRQESVQGSPAPFEVPVNQARQDGRQGEKAIHATRYLGEDLQETADNEEDSSVSLSPQSVFPHTFSQSARQILHDPDAKTENPDKPVISQPIWCYEATALGENILRTGINRALNVMLSEAKNLRNAEQSEA
jgi:hypothetical protein